MEINQKHLQELSFSYRHTCYAHEAMARAFKAVHDVEQQQFYEGLAKHAYKLADDYAKMASDWRKERKVDE